MACAALDPEYQFIGHIQSFGQFLLRYFQKPRLLGNQALINLRRRVVSEESQFRFAEALSVQPSFAALPITEPQNEIADEGAPQRVGLAGLEANALHKMWRPLGGMFPQTKVLVYILFR